MQPHSSFSLAFHQCEAALEDNQRLLRYLPKDFYTGFISRPWQLKRNITAHPYIYFLGDSYHLRYGLRKL